MPIDRLVGRVECAVVEIVNQAGVAPSEFRSDPFRSGFIPAAVASPVAR